MAKRRLRLKARVHLRRQRGDPPVDIARYVHRTCGPSWSRKIAWTLPERAELERLDLEFAERKAEEERKAAKAAADAARRAAAWNTSLPAKPRAERHLSNVGRKGLSPTAVREILGCTVTELERWVQDGRLPPDGVRFYYGVGPLGGSKWGRAWIPDTVAGAKSHLKAWRSRDAGAERRWKSEAEFFDLVRFRFPDAVRQWSPRWLGRQSVDIYVPSINVAFEYHGIQHPGGFLRRRRRISGKAGARCA